MCGFENKKFHSKCCIFPMRKNCKKSVFIQLRKCGSWGLIISIIIGDLQNYLLMMRIADILFSPRIHEDHMGYLSQLIFALHTIFRELYPSASVIPKMHFMVHMPRLTLQFVQTELIIVFNHSEPSLIQKLCDCSD